VTSHVPRLGPSIIGRPRLDDWLARFRSVPVRFLIAPPGFGKTVTLLSYLRKSAPKGLYCGLAAGATGFDIWANIARAMQTKTTSASHENVMRALAKAAPIELAIDCEGLPDGGGLAAICDLIEEMPEGVSLLIACRSRTALDAGRLVTRGMASLCDAERLAFGAAGIRHLSETCGVPFAHADVVRMLEVTDGWPQIVSGAIRKAAEDGCNLAEAYDNWQRRHNHLFNEFIDVTLKEASVEQAALVRKLMDGSRCDESQLQALEEQGLFVIHSQEGYRPLRALSHSRLHLRYARETHAAVALQVRMFGWFHAEIDGRPIEWIRRRDRQIFKYIALKPGGSATRAELEAIFWPGAEKHLVAQSLRTACSNIRKAIASIVGFTAVEAYFRTDGDISINLNNVQVDVNQFIAHANDGDEQFERGEQQAAYAHYRDADELYRGDLLIGDRNEPWAAAEAAILELRRTTVSNRLAEIRATLAAQPAFKARAVLAAS
jgi:Bacterial transcriptional activator domain